MSIVLFILIAFYVGFLLIQNKSHNALLEMQLNDAIENTNENISNVDLMIIEKNGKINIKNFANIPEDLYSKIYNDISDIARTESVFDNSGNYYYKFARKKDLNVFVLKDMTKEISILKENNLKAFAVLCGVYCFVFLLVSILSFKVFEPLEKMIENQKRFTSDASHELKTPLTIISANAEVLSENDNNQWIENIKVQTKRLQDLVGKMLSLAQFDENKPVLKNETFNLSALCYETILPFDAVAFESEKSLNVSIDNDVIINGNKASVKQIMSILTDNAIKYAIKNTAIDITLKKENNLIKFSVKNAGSSIKEEDSDKVFERFFRGANSRNRESGGSGLGLSIAKEIADANKWKINAESHYGISMEITLTIKTKK